MNWQVILCQACQGMNWMGCGGEIEFKVFQSVRGLEDDSVTRFCEKIGFGFRN